MRRRVGSLADGFWISLEQKGRLAGRFLRLCTRNPSATRSSALAKVRAERSSSASSSRRISPGWIGRMPHSKSAVLILDAPQQSSTISGLEASPAGEAAHRWHCAVLDFIPIRPLHCRSWTRRAARLGECGRARTHANPNEPRKSRVFNDPISKACSSTGLLERLSARPG